MANAYNDFRSTILCSINSYYFRSYFLFLFFLKIVVFTAKANKHFSRCTIHGQEQKPEKTTIKFFLRKHHWLNMCLSFLWNSFFRSLTVLPRLSTMFFFCFYFLLVLFSLNTYTNVSGMCRKSTQQALLYALLPYVGMKFLFHLSILCDSYIHIKGWQRVL